MRPEPHRQMKNQFGFCVRAHQSLRKGVLGLRLYRAHKKSEKQRQATA